MKAARIHGYGDPSVVVIEDTDKPAVSDGKVMVEVHAASLNPFDTAVRAGYMKDMIPLELPATLGGDIAGVVVEVSEGVTGFKVGDKVYGQAAVVSGNSGAFAEYAATSAEQVGLMPGNVDFQQAASLPLVGVSALQAIKDHINLEAGQKLFIHGGAGGIGTIAIQIAKHLGAYIATTATGDNIDAVKALGADEVIDYKTDDFAEKLSGYDAVYDTVGKDDFDKALRVLKRGGIAVSMIAQADERKVKDLGVMAISQATKVSTEKLDTLRGLVESGVVKPQVSKTFALDEIVQAFEERELGGVPGKIVIKTR